MTTLQTNAAATTTPPEGAVVLLVDDQLIIGEAVRRILAAHQGITYHFCQKPEEALALAAQLQPTVILQDLVMPGVDGLDLVRGYRQQDATKLTPLIVLSSKEEGTTKAEAFARGANDYIVKLPDPVELVARIRYHSRGYLSLLQRNQAFEALRQSQAALAAELSKAADYVRSLLPPPSTGDVSIDWRFVPSASLGGDCFDYFWIDDDYLAIYLLDVCGHGVGPALLGVSAMNSIRSISTNDLRDPASVLRQLNAAFQMVKHHGMYFTIWYGVYEKKTKKLRYSGGGHPPPLLMAGGAPPGGDAALKIQKLECEGLPVGITTDEPFAVLERDIEPGTSMLIYSDGGIEVFKSAGKLWGIDGLCDFIREHGMNEPRTLDDLHLSVKTMAGSDVLADDFSIVLVRFA